MSGPSILLLLAFCVRRSLQQRLLLPIPLLASVHHRYAFAATP